MIHLHLKNAYISGYPILKRKQRHATVMDQKSKMISKQWKASYVKNASEVEHIGTLQLEEESKHPGLVQTTDRMLGYVSLSSDHPSCS